MSSIRFEISRVDELYEAKDLDAILSVDYDWFESMRAVDYIEAVGLIESDPDTRRQLNKICFDMCVKVGALARACNLALVLDNIELLKLLVKICTDVKYVPAVAKTYINSPAIWTPVVHVRYGDFIQSELEHEIQVRNTMIKQMLFIIEAERNDITLARLGLDETNACWQEIIQGEKRCGYMKYIIEETSLQAPKNIATAIFKNGNTGSTKNCLDHFTKTCLESYGSAFVHAGFGADEVLSGESNKHIESSTMEAIIAALGGLGLLHLWNPNEGIVALDKFQYSLDALTRGGAALGFSLLYTRSNNMCDPVQMLVAENLTNENPTERICATLALGIAYAGSCKEELLEQLVPIIIDQEGEDPESLNSAAALATGMIFVGTGNEASAEAILELLLSKPEVSSPVRMYNAALGLGLIFLGTSSEAAGTLAVLRDLKNPLGMFAAEVLNMCAFAGTGDITQAQEFVEHTIANSRFLGTLQQEFVAAKKKAERAPPPATEEVPASSHHQEDSACSSKETDEPMEDDANLTTHHPVHTEGDKFLAALPAINAIAAAVTCLNDATSHDMVLRFCRHLLQFDSTYVRRAIPLAISIAYASNPNPAPLDILQRLMLDSDSATVLNSIFAFGIVGAGTNNTRIANILASLADIYAGESIAIKAVRLSQSLLSLGKGLLSISAVRGINRRIDKVSLACLLAFTLNGMYGRESLCSRSAHYLQYTLAPAIRPKWLICINEDMSPVKIPIRIGQAIDTAGAPGRPRSISGYLGDESPIIISFEEKVELGSGDYQMFAHELYGTVLTRPTQACFERIASRYIE